MARWDQWPFPSLCRTSDSRNCSATGACLRRPQWNLCRYSAAVTVTTCSFSLLGFLMQQKTVWRSWTRCCLWYSWGLSYSRGIWNGGIPGYIHKMSERLKPQVLPSLNEECAWTSSDSGPVPSGGLPKGREADSRKTKIPEFTRRQSIAFSGRYCSRILIN